MAGREVEAKLVLSAVDKTGKAFKSVSGRLGDVNKRAEAYNRQARSTNKTMVAVGRAAAAATTAIAIAGAAAYKNFAGDERTLTRIGITAEATREEMRKVRSELFNVANETGMQFEDSVRGLDALTSSGRTLEQAMALIPSVMATAQASGSDVVDIATSADALFTSLNIGAKDMQGAFDILVAGGKAGKFELKDMAQFLPSLAPAFKALGYEGESGLQKLIAALQTVRTQTGSSGEAATAFTDVLTKMESQTVTNNFKKMGVDLRGSLAEARKEGKDVLDTFIQLSKAAVKGDMSKLPQLFTDKQMLIGMRSLITSADKMKEFAAAVKNVDGATLKDLGVVLQDNQAKIDRMANSWDRFISNVGAGVSGPFSDIFDFGSRNLERNDAITAGMKADGLGFWERVSQFSGKDVDDPQMIKWAKAGGFKFSANDNLEGAAPLRRFSPAPGAAMPAPNLATAPAASISRLNNEDIAFSQSVNGRDGIAPPMMAGLYSPDDFKKNFQLDTSEAEQKLTNIERQASEGMAATFDLDTSQAEAKIDVLNSKVQRVKQTMSASGRNLGRSMPDAGR